MMLSLLRNPFSTSNVYLSDRELCRKPFTEVVRPLAFVGSGPTAQDNISFETLFSTVTSLCIPSLNSGSGVANVSRKLPFFSE